MDSYPPAGGRQFKSAPRYLKSLIALQSGFLCYQKIKQIHIRQLAGGNSSQWLSTLLLTT
jgi:hypothetical protein